jgi:nucleoside-diphosphate-sugar epimerase
LASLLAHGHTVIVVAGRAGEYAQLQERSQAAELSQTAQHPVMEHVANLDDRGAFLASLDGLGADAVISLHGADNELHPGFRSAQSLNRVRMEGTSTLLAATRILGASRFVGASSFEGYGLRDHGDIELAESAPFGVDDGPRATATQTALLSAEQQVRAFGGTVLRLGYVYATEASSIPPVCSTWSGSLPVIYADDAALGFTLALEAPGAEISSARSGPGPVYNLAAPAPATWTLLQQLQARANGFPEPIALPAAVLRAISPNAGRLIAETSMRLTSASAMEALGWSAAHPTLESAFLPANTATLVGAPA